MHAASFKIMFDGFAKKVLFIEERCSTKTSLLKELIYVFLMNAG